MFCSDRFFVPNNGFLVTGEAARYVRMGVKIVFLTSSRETKKNETNFSRLPSVLGELVVS